MSNQRNIQRRERRAENNSAGFYGANPTTWHYPRSELEIASELVRASER